MTTEERLLVPGWIAGRVSLWAVRLAGVVLLGGGFAVAWLRAAAPGVPITGGVPWALGVVGVAVVAITGFEKVVDVRARKVIQRWRVGVAIPFKRVSIEKFQQVLIRKDWRRPEDKRRHNALPFFPVELRSKGGRKRLEISTSADYERQRAKAVEIARALGLVFRDRPGKLERTPAELDTRLVDRRDVSGSEASEPPADSRIGVSGRPGEPRWTIPPGQYAWISAVFTALPVIAAAFFAFLLRESLIRVYSELPAYLAVSGAALASLVLVGFVGTTLYKLSRVVLGARVEVSSSAITVRRLTGLGPRTWALDVREVQEVEGNPVGVAIRGDGRHVTIGEGLAEDDLDWLRDTLTRALTA